MQFSLVVTMPACCGLGMTVICCLAVKNIWNQSNVPVLGTRAAQWTKSICRRISAGWHLSTPRNWNTAFWSCLDGFTTWHATFNLQCNAVQTNYSPGWLYCLHKCLLVCLPSHTSSCPIYTATAAMRTCFTCTCLMSAIYINSLAVYIITIFHAEGKKFAFWRK